MLVFLFDNVRNKYYIIPSLKDKILEEGVKYVES